jgi:hypothetical protein
MAAGRARAARCKRILRNGQQCRGIPMREAGKLGVNLCRWHCRGQLRDKVDARGQKAQNRHHKADQALDDEAI